MANIPRSAEPSQGDVKFIDPPDSLQCPVCLSTLKQPHLLSCCGSHMCENCIGCVKASGQPCPCCRENEYTSMLDKRTRGKVLGLRVQCSRDGCDWEGELGELERHLSNKCLYVEEVCPRGCGQSYPRHLLQTHQLDECPQRPLQLQLESLKRQLQLAQKYELLLERLVEDKKELQQQFVQQEDKIDKLTQQLMAITLPAPPWIRPSINIPNMIPPCYVAIDNFLKLKETNDKWCSPPFYSGPGGYRMRLGVYPNGIGDAKGTNVSVCAELIEGEFDDMLVWPYTGIISIEIINWKENKRHEKSVIDFSKEGALASGCGNRPHENSSYKLWGHLKALSHSKLLIHDKYHQFTHNNVLYIKVSNITI